MAKSIVPLMEIERRILVIRGHKVLLDEELAVIYGVPTKTLTRAVRRNPDRFPVDFMFRLTGQEFEALRRQIGTSKTGRGGRRYLPYAFTEHGAVMLAAVLNSPVAVEASIQVVRAFVRLRQLIQGNDKLRRKLARIEQKVNDHDQRFAVVFEAIRQLMDDEDDGDASSTSRIGYDAEHRSGTSKS